MIPRLTAEQNIQWMLELAEVLESFWANPLFLLNFLFKKISKERVKIVHKSHNFTQ